MKLIALAVVVLALGIVAGFALAKGVSDGPASAAPKCPGPSAQCPTPTPTPPTRQREDQITIFADGNVPFVLPPSDDWNFFEARSVVALDTDNYRAGSTFQFEAVLLGDGCMRLFDLTDGAAVSGSEVCSSQPFSLSLPDRQRSGPLLMPTGEHEYAVQGKTLTDDDVGIAARIIVEWTE